MSSGTRVGIGWRPEIDLTVDPMAMLDSLPLDRIAYVHVAGGTLPDGAWHDTHTHPIGEPVLALLTELVDRAPCLRSCSSATGIIPLPQCWPASWRPSGQPSAGIPPTSARPPCPA